MKEKSTTRLVAEVLRGLQVPRSISGRTMLGTALEPYDELCRRAGFGWRSVEQFEEMLTEKETTS